MPELGYGSSVRGLLRQHRSAREMFLQLVRGEVPPSAVGVIGDFLRQANRPESEIVSVTRTASALCLGEKIPDEDIFDAMKHLDSAKDSLYAALAHEYGSAELRPSTTPNWSSLIAKNDHDGATRRRQVVRDIIYRHPGLYIAEVAHLYQRAIGIEAHYSTVKKYVDELVSSREIVTIGGPQGVLRHCFPNPHNLVDWTAYHYRPFALKGTIDRRLTFDFEQSRGPWREVFLLNHQSPPTLLSLKFGKVLPQGSAIECFGVLYPPEKLGEFGLSSLARPRLRGVVDVAEAFTQDEHKRLYHDDEAWGRMEKITASER